MADPPVEWKCRSLLTGVQPARQLPGFLVAIHRQRPGETIVVIHEEISPRDPSQLEFDRLVARRHWEQTTARLVQVGELRIDGPAHGRGSVPADDSNNLVRRVNPIAVPGERP